jgi:hypothetical protein
MVYMRIPTLRAHIWSLTLIIAALPGLGHADSHQPTEQWQLGNEYQFYLWRHSLPGVYRSQGMATDGNTIYFSWQYGLELTGPQFNTILRNSSIDLIPYNITPGIPADLLAQGLNHIGDIDYHDGIIYASLDSTDGYMNGHVALYRGDDLTYTGVSFPLTGAASNPKHDLASWVAVDGLHGLGYGKEWQLGNTINVYRLNDWSFDHVLTMDMALESIQGAKIHGGWLYMSSNNVTRSVYRTNLATGHVEELFTLPAPAGHLEVEGMAIRNVCSSANAADCEPHLYVLMVVEPDNFFDDYVALYRYDLVPPAAAAHQ